MDSEIGKQAENKIKEWVTSSENVKYSYNAGHLDNTKSQAHMKALAARVSRSVYCVETSQCCPSISSFRRQHNLTQSDITKLLYSYKGGYSTHRISSKFKFQDKIYLLSSPDVRNKRR